VYVRNWPVSDLRGDKSDAIIGCDAVKKRLLIRRRMRPLVFDFAHAEAPVFQLEPDISAAPEPGRNVTCLARRADHECARIEPRKDPRHDLRARMHEIARTRVRYGYRRIHVLLKRDGWKLGKNQMYRLYREEQRQLRSKLPKRRKMVVVRRERIRPRAPNEVWSLDFVSD
jgi:hypothetical protein